MTKSNNQREAEDYKQEMAEMQARMAKMQKQLDKMRSEQAGVKPKTHLAALPKKSAKEIQKEEKPEKILASANAKQASVLSKSNPKTKAAAQQTSTSVRRPKSTQKAAAKKATKKVAPATRAQSTASQTNQRPKAASTSQKPVSAAASQSTVPTKKTAKPVFPGSTSTNPSHNAVSSEATKPQSAVKANNAPAKPASVAASHSTSAKAASNPSSPTPTNTSSVAAQPSSTAQPLNDSLTAESQGKQIEQMGKNINDLLASVGMDAKDAQDLPQTYFYFISLIDNGKLVDQGRIITFNTNKMNHNGVVKGTDGTYYLDLGYLSKPHPKADALPLPKGYLVDLDLAKTIPDVVTKDPSSTDTMDSKIKLGGSTTINMPESEKDSGYYIPLSKLNGGKIPVHKVSEEQQNGSPHQAFVSQQPSQTMTFRHPAPTSGSGNHNEIHFDQPKRQSKPQSSASSHRSSQAQAQRHHESSRTELRREREHNQQQKSSQHVGLGKALGTMFGFGNRR